jgi:hypothetical protein
METTSDNPPFAQLDWVMPERLYQASRLVPSWIPDKIIRE